MQKDHNSFIHLEESKNEIYDHRWDLKAALIDWRWNERPFVKLKNKFSSHLFPDFEISCIATSEQHGCALFSCDSKKLSQQISEIDQIPLKSIETKKKYPLTGYFCGNFLTTGAVFRTFKSWRINCFRIKDRKHWVPKWLLAVL